MIVNVHDAKSRLSELLRAVSAGEEVVIGRNGTPVARLIPYQPSPVRRRPGRLAGRITVADDFDATDPQLIADFEGQG